VLDGLKPDLIISFDGVNERNSLIVDARRFSHNRENQILTSMKGQDRNSIKNINNELDELTLKRYFLEPLQLLVLKMKDRMSRNEIKDKYDLSKDNVERVARELLDSGRQQKN
jgi:hypothetical protein